MRSCVLIFSVLILILLFHSCDINKNDSYQSFMDCDFEQIDENMDGKIDDNERKIMNSCMEQAYSSKNAIESNIIGEWRLIGHGEGWLPTISQPCAFISISSDVLTFEFRNATREETLTVGWEIEEVSSGSTTYFKLNTDSDPIEGLWITYFCEDYMYGDATPADGNMYLYEKVK